MSMVEQVKQIENQLMMMYPESYQEKTHKAINKLLNDLHAELTQTQWRNVKTGEYLSLKDYRAFARAANRNAQSASEYLEELGYENDWKPVGRKSQVS